MFSFSLDDFDLAIGFVGVGLGKLSQELLNFGGGFGQALFLGIVVLDAHLIALNYDIASIDGADLLNLEAGLVAW